MTSFKKHLINLSNPPKYLETKIVFSAAEYEKYDYFKRAFPEHSIVHWLDSEKVCPKLTPNHCFHQLCCCEFPNTIYLHFELYIYCFIIIINPQISLFFLEKCAYVNLNHYFYLLLWQTAWLKCSNTFWGHCLCKYECFSQMVQFCTVVI